MKPLTITTSNLHNGRGFRGFTLMEVMFAVMILGVGLIAIAGVLPVAGVLHRNTIDESEALAIGRTARAVLQARGVKTPTNTTGMQPIPMYQGDTGFDPDYPLPLADRAYPATTDAGDTFHVHHHYYWVPVAFFPTAGGSRQVFVFVMRNPEYSFDPDGLGVTYVNPKDGDPASGSLLNGPRVVHGYDVKVTSPDIDIIRIPWQDLNDDELVDNFGDKLGFGAGVRILDNHGTIHTIQSVGDDGTNMTITLTDPWQTTPANLEPAKIWFALADINDPNPTLHIAAMGGQGVLKP